MGSSLAAGVGPPAARLLRLGKRRPAATVRPARAAAALRFENREAPGAMHGADGADLPFPAATGAGVRIAVRLTPRAAQNGLDGVAPGPDGRPALRLRVAAPPLEGAANAALVAYVAESLRMRRSDVAVVSGERGRLKLLELSGDAAVLLARLADWVARGRRP